MRLFQNESSCKTFHKKDMFDLHEKEPVVGTHFHMNGFAGRLVLTQKVNSEMACLPPSYELVWSVRRPGFFRDRGLRDI